MKLGPSELKDDQLIAGLLQRAPWAAELLYDRLSPIVNRTLRRVFPTRRTDHDDLAQTAFENILRSVLKRRFRAGCSLSSWAVLITSRIAIDALRSSVRERVVFRADMSSSPDLLAAHEPVPLERRLEARSELERLQSLLGSMKPEQSLTVLLHDLFGHELAEVADFTGVSAAAAQSRLVRGRKELMRQREARRSMESQPDDHAFSEEGAGRGAKGSSQEGPGDHTTVPAALRRGTPPAPAETEYGVDEDSADETDEAKELQRLERVLKCGKRGGE